MLETQNPCLDLEEPVLDFPKKSTPVTIVAVLRNNSYPESNKTCEVIQKPWTESASAFSSLSSLNSNHVMIHLRGYNCSVCTYSHCKQFRDTLNNKPFHSCCLVTWPVNTSEAGVL